MIELILKYYGVKIILSENYFPDSEPITIFGLSVRWNIIPSPEMINC